MTDHLHLRRWCAAFTILGVLLLLPVFCLAADPHATAIAAYRACLPHNYDSTGTGSMYPWTGRGELFRPLHATGQICQITALPYGELTTGTWAVYWPPNRPYPLAHLCKHKEGAGRWVMQGINNPGPDPFYCTPENFIGIVHRI